MSAVQHAPCAAGLNPLRQAGIIDGFANGSAFGTRRRQEHGLAMDSTDDYFKRVKAEILAEAEIARVRAPLPRREPPPRGSTAPGGYWWDGVV